MLSFENNVEFRSLLTTSTSESISHPEPIGILSQYVPTKLGIKASRELTLTPTFSYRRYSCSISSLPSLPPSPSEASEMAPQPRLLTTLPSDVLREILGFVLDEPNGPSRAAVLLVGNSLLNELGTPLLFKHLRLATYTSWEAHFGVGGYLTPTENGGKGMGKFVKQLELDRLDVRDSGELDPPPLPLSLSFRSSRPFSSKQRERYSFQACSRT